MGGVVEGEVAADKTSLRRAEIEKSRAELRQTCEIRDKTKKELEFLLKGGNPLELESGNVASVSVQSTSFTEQHADQLVISEAKGSFAFVASPHGDSVESSGRLGTNACEPNSADNLMLFDAERELSPGNRMSSHPSRSNIVLSEKLSLTGGNRRIEEHGESSVFGVPRKAYKRRYRSRTNRDGTRSSSTDVNPTHDSHGSSAPSRHEPKDAKGLTSDIENPIMISNLNSKPKSLVDDTHQNTGLIGSQKDIELDDTKAVELTNDVTEGCPLHSASDAVAHDDVQHNRQAPLDVLQMDSAGPETIPAMGVVNFADIKCLPDVPAITVENMSSSHQMNGFINEKGEASKNDALKSASCVMKGLDSESPCPRTNQVIDGTNDADTTKMRSTNSNRQIKDQNSVPDKVVALGGGESMKDTKERGTGSSTPATVESSVVYQNKQEDGVELQPEEELIKNGSALENKMKDQTVNEGTGACKLTESDSGRKSADPSVDQAGPNNESSRSLRHQDSTDISVPDLLWGGSSMMVSTAPIEAPTSIVSNPKLTRTTDDDSILKEAKLIEAKRKRIAELSFAKSPKQMPLKSHWDYLLEEMAWLANDFAQERIWKTAAAAQISSQAALACHVRKQENGFQLEAKQVAHSLAKSVMEFWQLVEEKNEVLDQEGQGEEEHSVMSYAMRFRKYKNCSVIYNPAEVPLTPDGVSDLGIIDFSWKENLIEENLFYTVLPGTMETYRSTVKSHVAEFRRISAGGMEEACDAAAGLLSEGTDSKDNAEEDENTYDMSMAFEDSKKSGFGQKKQQYLRHPYGARPYELSSDILHMQGAENKVAHQTALLAKRPGGNFNVSIPTKRVRTASRKVVSAFSAGTSGFLQANKADASSGDTNSYQDDQGALQGASHVPYNVEVESVVKFKKQLTIGSAEVSMKLKKKKAKHLAAYGPRWQVDSTFQNEQFRRDHLRNSHQHESNCSSGLLGQPMAKKQKTVRQSQDYSFENITPIGGSAPSPVTSQMSNMSNPNKFVKMLGGRDRGRKQKLLKISAGQSGSGNPWTLFEDQALVVLAHDLGPNWELVSDAINSTLQFKCIFRKATECKERHNFLMDRTSGDGADSGEDSGSSQPYPSTLPGIPKGSARQLFQRLQGPMEEETLRSHFEKIIIIGQKQHYLKPQNDNQDPKQLQQPHSSHTSALSQVCPNNLNGGSVLTPLDLCDSTIAGDSTITGNNMLTAEYQGPHSGGLAIPNQGTVTPMHPASGPTSSLQGSPPMLVGSNFSSSPSSLNSSVRDARYGPPRPVPLPADEHHRMQKYNQIMSGRSMSQPNASAPIAVPGTERSVRLLPGGSGMGLVSGVNRGLSMVKTSVSMAKSGFQAIASPTVVSSGSMVSPGIPSPIMHSDVGSAQGSSMLKPREALHIMRPGLGQADLQMQPPSVNSQVPHHHFSGLSSPFPKQQPQVLSPCLHPHFPGPTVNHTPSPHPQAYPMRPAKEPQNHLLHQPQANVSNSMTPHIIRSQPQLPLQNNPQVHPQTVAPRVSLSPANSIKQQSPATEATRNASAGGTNQTNQKQDQLSQANSPHPQKRQQTQSQQLANKNKVSKGVGRGNPVVHLNVQIDRAIVNGVSTSPGQSVPLQKTYPCQGGSSAKNLHPTASPTDKSSLGHVPLTGSNRQHISPHQKSATSNQLPVHRVVQKQKKAQSRDPSGGKRLTSSVTEMDKIVTLPKSTSSASDHQWQALEQSLDKTTLSSNTSSVAPVLLKATGSAVHNSQQLRISPQHLQPQEEALHAGNGKLSGGPGERRLE